MTAAVARSGGLRNLTLRLDLLALFALGVLVNSCAAYFITQPGYADAYYYFGGATQLASGQGLSEPYLWNYLTPARLVDVNGPLWPSHLYWMPLASMVAAPFVFAAQALARTAANATLFRAAQVPFILIASGLPALSYGVAAWVSAVRRRAIAAGLLTLFSPFYFVFWTTTDAFALFAVTSAGALVLAALAEAYPARRALWLLGAGLAAGLAHLTRADGLLVLLCLLAWEARRGELSGRLGAAGWLLGGYAVVMVPWFLRNWAVVGAPLAPGAAHALWLTNYDDLFTFSPDRLSAANYLSAGIGAILAGKWSALLDNLQSLLAVQCAIVTAPFVLMGLWRLRGNNLIRLGMFYGLALLAVMTLVFTFPGARGGYFHSGAALLPFLMPAAAVGLDSAVETAARRLRHWQPERSKPIFTALLLGFALVLTLVVFGKRVLKSDLSPGAWAEQEQVYGEMGAWLQAQGQEHVITAVNDPPGWYYWTERPAIVIPNGDEAVLQMAMTTFGARWLVLDENRPAPLAGMYAAPQGQPTFALRATFTDSAGQPAYLFELEPGP